MVRHGPCSPNWVSRVASVIAAIAATSVSLGEGVAHAQTAPAGGAQGQGAPTTQGAPGAQATQPAGTPRAADPARLTPPPDTDASHDALLDTPDAPPAGPRATQPQVKPTDDEKKLVRQGRERPTADGTIGGRASEVYSEDWWSHTRPVFELHGYFRTRGELFHNFALGRGGDIGAGQNLWGQPLDNSYTDVTGPARFVQLCGKPDAQGNLRNCQDKTQSTANLRLRLNPELHISDNLRILSQIDLLDNLVLGSTPDAYALRPTATQSTGYNQQLNGYNGYAPLSAFSTTQGPPTSGVNGYRNSIDVQRAWAEYLTPVGQLRFGRMPNHWGLGMVYNAGDCLDCDYQTNVDRIMFSSGIKSMDLYFGGAWHFISTGPTNASAYDVYGGQPYNVANLSNVGEWLAFVAKRTNPEVQRRKLARGEVVLNGGTYTTYRNQTLDVKSGENPLSVDRSQTNNGFERREAKAFVPDVWIQFLWQKLRLEAEVASIWGSLGTLPGGAPRIDDPTKIRMWGVSTQAEYRAVEDKLRIGFGHGWASGDPNVEGLAPGSSGLQPRQGEGAISTFRFHPAHYVDYIFFRRIMSRVQGAYYFRPSVEYDFLRNPNGQKLGGGAAVIWSRASEFVQTPGNKRDLGVELDLQLYYQAKDGTLNDDPSKMGGFYAALQYGVFFPLGGLSYLPGDEAALRNRGLSTDLGSAQTIRLILGVMF